MTLKLLRLHMNTHASGKIKYSFLAVEDFPENVEMGLVYIVGAKGHEWLAAFRCPCGCGDVIQLNLLKGSHPRWRIIYYKKRKFSISPSIDRIVNCKSHFTLVKGEIRWWGVA
jgi:hypothetical protein